MRKGQSQGLTAKYLTMGAWILAIAPVLELARGQLYSAITRETKSIIDTIDQALAAHDGGSAQIVLERGVKKRLVRELDQLSPNDSHWEIYNKLLDIYHKGENDEMLKAFMNYEKLGSLRQLVLAQRAIYASSSEHINVFHKAWGQEALHRAQDTFIPQMRAHGFLLDYRSNITSPQRKRLLTSFGSLIQWTVDTGVDGRLSAQLQELFQQILVFLAHGHLNLTPTRSEEPSSGFTSTSLDPAPGEWSLGLKKLATPFKLILLAAPSSGFAGLIMEFVLYRIRREGKLKEGANKF